jgi:hypothetical protein
MSAPVITSIAFDKSFYASGQIVTMTVTYTPDTYTEVDVTVVATGNASTDSSTSAATGFVVEGSVDGLPTNNDNVSWAVSDPAHDTWTQVSDNGSVAVFTTTAP